MIAMLAIFALIVAFCLGHIAGYVTGIRVTLRWVKKHDGDTDGWPVWRP